MMLVDFSAKKYGGLSSYFIDKYEMHASKPSESNQPIDCIIFI